MLVAGRGAEGRGSPKPDGIPRLRLADEAEDMAVKEGGAGEPVKNHPVTISEYVVVAEDSATSPAADDDDKENFIRVFNAVDKSVKFDTNVAASFIQKHDFKGLEEYVLDVLTEVQGTCLYHHPGIFCSIYEAQISYLIKEELFLEVENVFNDKVKPLLNENIDELYKPSDLDSRVKMVQNCVNNRKQLTLDGHEDIVGLLFDYFRLYFPSCLMDDTGRQGSVEDFVVALTDENGVRLTRCLACQWVVASSSMDQGKLVKHYRGDIHVKSCFSVTKWMLAYLDYLQSKDGTEIQRNPVVKSSLKKRKNPSPLCDQVVQITVTEALVSKCDDVFRAIISAAFGIAAHKELHMAAVTKGQDILLRQQKLISDLMSLFFHSSIEQDPLDASVAFQKVRGLCDLSRDLVQLSRHLPSSTGLLLDVYLKVAYLKTGLVLAEVSDLKAGFVLTAAGEFGGTSSEGTQFSGCSSVGSCPCPH